mmetsp:Transcript_53804/g.149248  ORF Transcript_53804/g.149248 Transcript_53804/m.149248 type:complete len:396 (+) Transcript_53804:170-1357(+)
MASRPDQCARMCEKRAIPASIGRKARRQERCDDERVARGEAAPSVRKARQRRAVGDAAEQLGEGDVGAVHSALGRGAHGVEGGEDLGGARGAEAVLGELLDGGRQGVEAAVEGRGEARQLLLRRLQRLAQRGHRARRRLAGLLGDLQPDGAHEDGLGRVRVRDVAGAQLQERGLLGRGGEVARGLVEKALEAVERLGEAAAAKQRHPEAVLRLLRHVGHGLRDHVQGRGGARHGDKRRLHDLVRLAEHGENAGPVFLGHRPVGGAVEGLREHGRNPDLDAACGLVDVSGEAVDLLHEAAQGAIDVAAHRLECAADEVVGLVRRPFGRLLHLLCDFPEVEVGQVALVVQLLVMRPVLDEEGVVAPTLVARGARGSMSCGPGERRAQRESEDGPHSV